MLPAIGLGDKLRITRKADRSIKQSYISQVGDILGNDLILAHTPVFHGKLTRLPIGDEYAFLFYTQHDLVQASGTILGYSTQNGLDYMKIRYQDCQRIQRRLYFRQNCYFDFTFSQVSKEEEQPASENPPVHHGIVKNLSGGGLCFVSDVVLTVGDQLVCQLKLNEVAVQVNGIVRAVEPPQKAEDKYHCRIEFVDIDPAVQEHIIEHVFYLQTEMLKKMKYRR